MYNVHLELNFLISKMRTFAFLLSFVSISVQKFSLDISTRVEALEAAMSLMNEELNERDAKIATQSKIFLKAPTGSGVATRPNGRTMTLSSHLMIHGILRT